MRTLRRAWPPRIEPLRPDVGDGKTRKLPGRAVLCAPVWYCCDGQVAADGVRITRGDPENLSEKPDARKSFSGLISVTGRFIVCRMTSNRGLKRSCASSKANCEQRFL